jgi:hypothetical protein
MVHKDEMYPVFYADDEDIPKHKLKWVKKGFSEFYKVQDYLEELYMKEYLEKN